MILVIFFPGQAMAFLVKLFYFGPFNCPLILGCVLFQLVVVAGGVSRCMYLYIMC